MILNASHQLCMRRGARRKVVTMQRLGVKLPYVYQVQVSKRNVDHLVPFTGINLTVVIERFSFECRNTKTKVITLTNQNSRKQSIHVQCMI